MGRARAVRVVPRGAKVARRVAGCLSRWETHHCQHQHGCEHDAHRYEHLNLHGEARGHLDGLHGVHSATNAAFCCCWYVCERGSLSEETNGRYKLRAAASFPEGSGIAWERLRVPGSRAREVRTVPGCLLVCYRPLANYRPRRGLRGCKRHSVLVSRPVVDRKRSPVAFAAILKSATFSVGQRHSTSLSAQPKTATVRRSSTSKDQEQP